MLEKGDVYSFLWRTKAGFRAAASQSVDWLSAPSVSVAKIGTDVSNIEFFVISKRDFELLWLQNGSK